MTRLFRRGPRTDPAPSQYTESRFAFLDRVDSRFFGDVRELLESWYAAYPDDDEHLHRGFCNDDDRSHSAAFWELYLYTAYRACGRGVEVHPDLGTGSQTRPDFLIEGSTPFVVEARLLMTPEEARSADARTSPLYDAIDELSSDDFFVWVSGVEMGETAPSLTKFKVSLEEWLDSLDADLVITRQSDDAYLDSLPTTVWEDRGWAIEIRAIPKDPDARGKPARLLGMMGEIKANWIDDHTPFVKTLKSKSPSKYGEFELPYVIAVLSEGISVGEDDVFSALFGREAVRVTTLPDGEHDVTPIRHPDGYWHGPRGYYNSRVSAVLVAHKLFPWTIATSPPRLWLNPYPASPLPDEDHHPWATAIPDHDNGEIVKQPPPRPLHELFGIASDWPGPEDLKEI